MPRPPLEVADLIHAAGTAFFARSRKWFTWLHRLSHAEFREAAKSLRDSALRAASHNLRVASLFASVFAQFGRFTVEAEIIMAARTALPEGRLYARQTEALDAVRRAAEENDRRARGG